MPDDQIFSASWISASQPISQIQDFLTINIGLWSVADLETLPENLLHTLSSEQIAAINSATISNIDPAFFTQFLRSQIASLTTTQIASLTSSEVGTLAKGKLARLSASQIAAIDPVSLAGLGAGRIANLSATQLGGMTITQIRAMSARELSGIASFHELSTSQIAAIDSASLSLMNPTSFQQFNRTEVAFLTTTQISALSPAELGTLGAGKLAALNAAQIAAIEPSALAGLGAVRIGDLTATQMAGLTTSQIQSLNVREIIALAAGANTGQVSEVADLNNMTGTEIRALSTTEIASLSITELVSLPTDLLQSLSSQQVAAISENTLSALDPAFFTHFLRNQIASLTTTQIASLTSAEVGTLAKGKLARLSASQIAAIDPVSLAGLGAGRIASLTALQLEALTATQLDALNIREINAVALQATKVPTWGLNQALTLQDATIAQLSVNAFEQLVGDFVGSLSSLAGVSVADFQSLTKTQFSSLNAQLLATLEPATLSQISPLLFTTEQIADLPSSILVALTTTFFDALPAASLAAISPTAIAALSLPTLLALSSTQIAELTQTQLSAMNAQQLSVVFDSYNPLIDQAENLEVAGVLGINGAISLLKSVASGGDNFIKFQQLQALGNCLQTSDDPLSQSDDSIVIVATSAVKTLFDDVVFGDFENALWNGGSFATTLGNLSSTSPEWQFNGLIDKWFLGSDLPTLQIDVSGAVLSTNYVQTDLPLYDPSGSPELNNVMEGSLDDSALLAGIAETTLQDPDYVKKLIVDNGNGTYQVEQPNMFSTLFVTVNNELPQAVNGSGVASATNETGLWVALLEKAAAQNFIDSSMAYGQNMDTSVWNCYASLTTDVDDQIMLYSGQYYNTATFSIGETQDTMQNVLSSIKTAFSDGNNVIYENNNHFYAVTGIDTVNDIIDIFDPKGGYMTAVSLQTMAKNEDNLFYGITPRTSA